MMNQINVPKKILVAGAGGYMGLSYLNAFAELHTEPNLLIACDINSENLAKVRPAYPLIRTETDLLKSLENRPDIVFVLVNSHAHRSVIETCYRAGVRKFFVEKPLVLSLNDLSALKRLSDATFYTSYVINFSPHIQQLTKFMREHDLVVNQARSVWGKNWCAVDRFINGNAEEELPHPLGLILTLVSVNQKIQNTSSRGMFSHVPYLSPTIPATANFESSYAKTDSSLIDVSLETDLGQLSVHIMGSFNLYDQQRWVEVSLVKKGAEPHSAIPKFKARLNFDINGSKTSRTDEMKIKDAATDKVITETEWNGNRLQIQLACALQAFEGGEEDPRLINFERSSQIVRIVNEALESNQR